MPANQPPANVAWSQIIARTTNRIPADLVIDGRAICRLPCQTTLPSGAHRIAGRGPGGSSAEHTVYFAPGAAVPVLLDVVSPRGVLRVSAASRGTLIYVDSVLVGNTSWQGAVAPGPHLVQLRRPTGESLQQKLTVAPGMTYSIRDNAPARPPATAPRPVTPPVSPAQPLRPPPGPSAPAPSAPAPTSAPYQGQLGQRPYPGQSAPTPYQAQPAQPPMPFQGQQSPAIAPSQNQPAPSGGQYPNQPASGTSSNALSQEQEPATADEARFRGITGALFAPIMLGGASTNDYGDHCPATAFGGYCTDSGPRGGGLAARLGYAFGWIAPEAMVGLTLDMSSGGLHLPDDISIPGDDQGMLTQIAGDTKFVRLGMLAGAGVRMATIGRNSRFTFSSTFGLVKRNVYIVPDSFFGQKPSYTAKTLFFDTGILLGDSPGTKIYGGFFLWLEFVPNLVITRDVTKLNLDPNLVPASLVTSKPFQGTQVMFGPLLGLTFGH